jgi:hypothetical protein
MDTRENEEGCSSPHFPWGKQDETCLYKDRTVQGTSQPEDMGKEMTCDVDVIEEKCVLCGGEQEKLSTSIGNGMLKWRIRCTSCKHMDPWQYTSVAEAPV